MCLALCTRHMSTFTTMTRSKVWCTYCDKYNVIPFSYGCVRIHDTLLWIMFCCISFSLPLILKLYRQDFKTLFVDEMSIIDNLEYIETNTIPCEWNYSTKRFKWEADTYLYILEATLMIYYIVVGRHLFSIIDTHQYCLFVVTSAQV